MSSTAEVEVKAEQKTRPVEEIKAELDKARAAFTALTQERSEIADRLKEAGKEDREALTQAALSGSLKKVKTPQLDKARARAGELPFLLWAAEVRVLELSEEHASAKHAELEAELQELHPRVVEAEAAAKEAQQNLVAATNAHASVLEERRDIDRGRHNRQGRLAQLRDSGPEV